MATDQKKTSVEIEETIKHERILQEEDYESKKRRLLNLPQQPSALNKNNKKQKDERNTPSRHSNNSQTKQEEEKDKKSSEQRRKDRDNSKENNPSKNRNNHLNQKNGRNTNSNPLSNKVNPLGNKQNQNQKKENKATKRVKSIAKKRAKKAAKKGAKKAAKKGAKLFAKAAKKLISKGIAMITNTLVALIGSIGLPAFLIVMGIILLIVILMVISTTVLGTGKGIDEMGPEAKEIRAYIVQLSEDSIDPNKPEQIAYKIPEELLAAIVQLDSFNKEKGKSGSLQDYKALLDEFASQLYPEFTYETYTEWTMTSTKKCTKYKDMDMEDDTAKECAKYEWSTPKKSQQQVSKITQAIAWNGTGTFEYEAEDSDWVVSGNTKTKSRTYVIKKQDFEYNFSKLDAILTAHGYKEDDKKWFEYFYESATETKMHYTEWLETGSVDYTLDGGSYFDGTITPGGGVPTQFMPYYLEGQAKFGVPWYMLAAVHWKETTYSTNPLMISNTGAVGPMQFIKKTWVGWSWPGNSSTIPDSVLNSPAQIKKYGGYGTDANGDGKADPWDPEDAIVSAAKYLKADGILTNPRSALEQYNGSPQKEAYATEVLAMAEKIKNSSKYDPSDSSSDAGSGKGSKVAKIAIAEARKYLGRAYVWGGSNPTTGFDCSGLVQWSYNKAGISLPRTSGEQYRATKRISASQAKTGDLVFFSYGSGISHVGIYLGGGQMLDSQDRGVVVESLDWWQKYLVGYGRISGVN